MDIIKRCVTWLLLFFTGLSSADVVVTDITVTDSQRISRTEFEYTFQVELENTDPTDVTNVTVTVESPFNHTRVTEGELTFEDIPQGETAVSTDTFTVLTDRRHILDPETLTYTIAYDPQDDVFPTLRFTAPTDGSVVGATHPEITLSYSDDESGIDEASFKLSLNGSDVTSSANVTETGASYTPTNPLTGGSNYAVAEVADHAGNVTTIQMSFSVSAFQANADCAPTAGAAPLTVRFRSRGVYTNGSIELYQWDFDGDGAFDQVDPVARDHDHTYQASGSYVALLQVTNNHDEVVTDTCAIEVGGSAPAVSVDASPSNGATPLAVNFTCTATDTDGEIASYEWDFDGDGSYDYSSAESGSTNHTYTTVGEYNASCRVTDSDGLSSVATNAATIVRPSGQGSPTVVAYASPPSGPPPLSVLFSGSASDDGGITLWEWDFDGDGNYDYSSSTSARTSHTYESGGDYVATLRVTDSEGNTGLDSLDVLVNVTATLSIPVDTFQPGEGETAQIDTTLSSNLQVRLRIKNGRGNTVRTLIDEQRTPGDYSDTWDGLNDAGEILPEGPYYAVLEYDHEGEVLSVDLTNTTGGERYNPTRTGIPSSFSPFDRTPLTIDFTLDRGASEVTAFMGLRYTNVRLMTFMERKPFGSGTHRIVWNGVSAEGKLIKPPERNPFLFGIWGYTLPDNAIYLRNGANPTELVVEPSIYNPTGNEDEQGTNNRSRITFSLNKTADVELLISNAETGVAVARRYHSNLSSGSNTVTWDGLDDNGLYVEPGRYRIGIVAIDATGYRSMRLYALQRVYY
jgi:PKD repeat protein